jgi:hypothetical protein
MPPVSNSPSSPKNDPDWIRIEADYRAGVKTLRQIASEHGITHGAINKRAKRDDWTRDLAAKIRAKADALVSRAAVSTSPEMQRLATEKQVVESGARSQASVRMTQQDRISRGGVAVMRLLDEVERASTDPGLFARIEAALALAKPGEELAEQHRVTMSDGLQRALSLGNRTGVVRQLMEALRIQVTLEREAYGIDPRTKPENVDPIAALLRGIGATALPVVPDDPAHRP